MTDLTEAALRAHTAEGERISGLLEVLARDVYIYRLDGDVKPQNERLDTIAHGHLESWEVYEARADNPAHVSATFYVSGRYGYSDTQSIDIPLTYLAPTPEGGEPVWMAPEAEARKRRAKAKGEAARRARAAQEAEDRARLAELRQRYPDEA